MAYPTRPPAVDDRVETVAKNHALARRASTMGMRSKSGGTGRTRLCRKHTPASAHTACRVPALRSVQL